jgi:hypothetical protein
MIAAVQRSQQFTASNAHAGEHQMLSWSCHGSRLLCESPHLSATSVSACPVHNLVRHLAYGMLSHPALLLLLLVIGVDPHHAASQEGHVKQPKQSCLLPPLLREGYVAICCATPISDVRLLTHQSVAVRKWKSQQPTKGK